MERNFFAEATHEVPDGKIALSNYERFKSVYGQKVSANAQPGDYKVPLKNNNTMCKPHPFPRFIKLKHCLSSI